MKSDIIFLAIRPQNLKKLLQKKDLNVHNKIVITTVAAIFKQTYYKYFKDIKLVRIIPSMINKVGGPILVNYGNLSAKEKKLVTTLLQNIGTIYEIDENQIDAFTHLTSCSPAIIIEFLRLYINSLKNELNINENNAQKIMAEVLSITSNLFKKEGFELIPQVCTKGGITVEGIKIMDKYRDSFFKELSQTLLNRMKIVREKYG